MSLRPREQMATPCDPVALRVGQPRKPSLDACRKSHGWDGDAWLMYSGRPPALNSIHLLHLKGSGQQQGNSRRRPSLPRPKPSPSDIWPPPPWIGFAQPADTSAIHFLRRGRLMPRPGLCTPCNVQQAAERLLSGSMRPYQTRGGASHIVPVLQHAADSAASTTIATRQAGRPTAQKTSACDCRR